MHCGELEWLCVCRLAVIAGSDGEVLRGACGVAWLLHQQPDSSFSTHIIWLSALCLVSCHQAYKKLITDAKEVEGLPQTALGLAAQQVRRGPGGLSVSVCLCGRGLWGGGSLLF